MGYRHKNAAPSPQACPHRVTDTCTVPSYDMAARTAGNGGYANGNGAREAMATEFFPTIRHIAIRIAKERHLPPDFLIDDLISAGGEALIKIADRFDETRRVKFSTYAGWRVEGAMLDHMRECDSVGRQTRENIGYMEAAYDSLTQRLGRQPSQDEVAKELSWTIEKLHHVRLRQMLGNSITFPDMASGDSHGFCYSAREEKSPFDLTYEREVHDMLQTGLARLPPRDREVLDLYYAKGITMKEISRQIGVNESRVSQLRARAISRLREILNKEQGAGETGNLD